MRSLTINIKSENYLWLQTISELNDKTPKEMIEELINQKIEENIKNG